MKMLHLSTKKIFIVSILFMLGIYTKSMAGSVSVSSFITSDDVTVAHLETMRSDFQGAINSADGGLLQSATVTSAKLDANTNPENRWDESFNDYVYTGLTIPTSTDLSSTTTAGTAYVYGVRVVKDATANTYTASKHIYVDLSKTGTYTYSEVEINASAPSVAANSIRLALVSTDTSKVLSVTDKRVTSVSTMQSITGSFTRNMQGNTGNVSYTGVGFTPKAIIFFGGKDDATLNFSFWGATAAASSGRYLNYLTTAGQMTATGTPDCIALQEDATKSQTAQLLTFDTDGFTLSWTKNGSPSSGTGIANYIAFR